MRIWSLHPKYLDAKGLVALWREALLAKHVLEGKTKGYKNHPQLIRFRKSKRPVDSINNYLKSVYNEAVCRGYKFNKSKIDWQFKSANIKVTKGQINYEAKHLLKKLKKRDRKVYNRLSKVKRFLPHPMFKIVDGDPEEWEKIDDTVT